MNLLAYLWIINIISFLNIKREDEDRKMISFHTKHLQKLGDEFHIYQKHEMYFFIIVLGPPPKQTWYLLARLKDFFQNTFWEILRDP